MEEKNQSRGRALNAAVALAAVAAFASSSAYTRADVPAFSGADGAGAYASGGRGGVVYHVTRLDTRAGDNGPGTLQYGVNDSNFKDAAGNVIPRTIVFDVGGTVWLGNRTTDTEGWDTTSTLSIGTNVTLAGQTAPGGITIAGGRVKVNGTSNPSGLPYANDIVRNVTLAAGYGTRHVNSTTGYADQYTFDAMDVNGTNVIVDHVSTLFATDESISIKDQASAATVQYSTMAQGQNYPEQDAEASGTVYTGHSLGGLISPASNSTISLLHNLYAHEAGRAPAVQTETSHLTKDSNGNYIPGFLDFRNNVVYDWLGSAGYGSNGEPGNANLIGNYYKVGPGGDTATHTADPSIVHSNGGTTVFSGTSSTQIDQSGNVRQNLNGTTTNLTNGDFGAAAFQSGANPVPYYGNTETAADAYNQVLNYVGANWQSRSAIDARIVNQVRTGTGQITAFDDPAHGYDSNGNYVSNSADTEWNKLLALRSTANGGAGATGTYVRAANYDTDGDGMPDVWEHAMGLSPAAADNNGTVTNSGYTNLEEYLNELAAFPADAPLVFNNANGDTRYAEIGNWQTGIWKPSRYDQARINTGTATIDVVGQHADTLQVAAASGSSAALAVTSGWIDVAQSLQVGAGGQGTVNQTGGIVHAAGAVIVGSGNTASSYNLTGGILATPLLAKGNAGSTFSFTGGTLHADTVAFDLTNDGGILAPGSDGALQAIALAAMPDITGATYAPSSQIGNTHVMGNLTLAAGTLQLELASLNTFDTLTVDDTLTLGGNLDLEFLNGYTPTHGDQFLIATASAITGQFDSVPTGFATQISGNNLYLTAVPEPSLALPAAAALLATAALARHRRRRTNGLAL